MKAILPRRCAAPLIAGMCAAMLLAPAASAAETKQLYKCVNGKGVVSIQSSRCLAGSTEAWHRPAPVEPAPTPEQSAAAAAKILRDEQTVRELSAEVEKKLRAAEAGTPTTPAAAPTPAPATSLDPPTPEAVAIDSCQAAQAFAGAVREKSWLGITEDQTRRLYGWVADQCKVQTKPSD